MLKLGILDIGKYDYTQKAASKVLDETLDLVQEAERLGFHRYWLGEHHSNDVAWRSPETLIPLLAGLTERIKIGAAGILLGYHSPLRVAHTFKMLSYMFVDRIDLGLAKGFVNGPAEKVLGNIQVKGKQHYQTVYNNKISELVQYLNYKNNTFSAEDERRHIHIPPHGVTSPPIWLLGSSSSSLPLAVNYSTNFCLSLAHSFDSLATSAQTLEDYRSQYEEKTGEKPISSICVAGSCSFTKKASNAISTPSSQPFPIVMVEGSPSICEEQLLALQDQFKADEIIFLETSTHYEEKLATYTLLSEIFTLQHHPTTARYA